MKQKIHISAHFVQMFLLLISVSTSYAQNDSAALATADTSRFSVNASEGWLLYNSYVAEYGTDSATLELIIRHENNINWSQEHYVGKIKYEALLPQTGQLLVFRLLHDEYLIRIEPSGNCYLRLTSGMLPAENPVVIPIITRYKR